MAVIGSGCCRYSKISSGYYREMTVAEVNYLVKSEKVAFIGSDCYRQLIVVEGKYIVKSDKWL